MTYKGILFLRCNQWVSLFPTPFGPEHEMGDMTWD